MDDAERDLASFLDDSLVQSLLHDDLAWPLSQPDDPVAFLEGESSRENWKFDLALW